jgi:DNA-binding GntR family transcriptional regulator
MAARHMTDLAPSKSKLAHTYLRERIIEGQFGPGYRLVLAAIAKQLDISPVPVREAIRMLEAEGLVSYERNVGAMVAMTDEAEYVTTMQALAIVEGAATGLASGLLDPGDLDRAREVNRRMAASLAEFDPREFTLLNGEFHALLFGKCPNTHLLDLVHRGGARLDVLRDSTFGFVPGRARESVADHERLLALISGGASAWDVEFAARAHRTATLDAFLAHHSDQFTR